MSQTATATQSYTVVDVGKVFACFATDFDLMRESTGLWPDGGTADHLVADVTTFAQFGYVDMIAVVLHDAGGRELRASHYEPSTSASSWSADRPGGCIWPRTPGGSLNAVIDPSNAWHALDASERDNFRQSKLKMTWPEGSVDLTHPNLISAADRRFASNSYGLRRTSYS